jgi:hypothetical protein
MNVFNELELSAKYSKKDLASILNEDSLIQIREGVFSCKYSNSYFLFVDLEKEGKEERFHFNDYFEEEYFHWDSQTTQHISSPKIQSVMSGELETHLFVRIFQKVKGQTQPFLYCGRLQYIEHDANTSKPVHILFQNIDYDDFTENDELIEIYLWKPEKAGMTSGTKITKKGVVSEKRRNNYTKPTTTERTGLVTSRVGQGYFRNQLIDKYDNKCAVTKSELHSILIASHIVPWSESNEQERLDANNGILLSPLYDALFDKNLISFDDEGRMLISDKISNEISKLNINKLASIQVNKEMKPYLQRHRVRLK